MKNLFILFLLIFCCNLLQAQVQTIKGIVRLDSDSTTVLDSVSVELSWNRKDGTEEKRSTQTNKKGAYQFDGLATSSINRKCKLTLKKMGNASQVRIISTNIVTITQDFYLLPVQWRASPIIVDNTKTVFRLVRVNKDTIKMMSVKVPR